MQRRINDAKRILELSQQYTEYTGELAHSIHIKDDKQAVIYFDLIEKVKKELKQLLNIKE